MVTVLVLAIAILVLVINYQRRHNHLLKSLEEKEKRNNFLEVKNDPERNQTYSELFEDGCQDGPKQGTRSGDFYLHFKTTTLNPGWIRSHDPYAHKRR
jgi:hypothetical protein